ncbi:TonB-dependent receptor plug domain-containing protein [Salinimicrobium xinjiangense]|uniref:TonB-dependent receptor plug domain-containing protein n=1 Tax=Salinimicrobium xinjiangense TaxID=438596 RepID=UPI0003F513A1|nr:TonB-dependent receptor [Salinimicrobium xinjiangense]
MMKKGIFYILLPLLLCSLQGYGQLDSVQYLKEVVLSDIHLYRNSKTHLVQVLNDSVLEQNAPALTSVLKFNSPLYFRENGPGMVASASFRGTTASQTAVVWNGININSQFTGQTDFNTILTSGYESVAVRSGGGSVLYGSGAIGGSVHLNNRFRIGTGFRNKVRLDYGSFDTFFGNIDSEYSSDELSLQLNVSRHSNENDFPYPDSEKHNQNGDYENSGISAAVAYLLNNSNTLKFYTNHYNGDRGFSGTVSMASKSKYEDYNSRNLLEWNSYFGRFVSGLKLAYLEEEYKYFENRHSDIYSFGKAETALAKYNLSYAVNENFQATGLLEIQRTEGEGSNIEGSQKRETGSAGVLISHDLYPFKYEISARAEFSDSYDSPILFSAGAVYEVTEAYLLKINVSRNYRIPTFNDLFWHAGGNSDLKPEKSLQAEIGQELRIFGAGVSISGFIIDTEDLLRWVPSSGGKWIPHNTKEARNYGLETTLDWNRNLKGQEFSIFGTYAYTRAIDRALDKELIYVPKHKATASAGYGYGKFSSFFQFLYNGTIYTSSDNNYSLPGYTVSNAGVNYKFLKQKLQLGIEVRNIFKTEYQSMPSRPMPGRAFYSSLTFKF